MKNILLPLFLLMTIYSSAQVGIGTKIPEPSAMLEVKSNTKGVLISRMTETERSAIKSPVAGLLVYQTDRSTGFYYHTGSEWKYLPPATVSQQLISSTTANSALVSTAAATTYVFNSPLLENTGIVSLPKATSVTSGYLSSADWNTFNNKLSVATGQAALNTKVTANTAITAGTKTKITFDSKGLITGGSNALTTDIAEGTNKYYTDARSRAAISLTTSGTSGAATYNNATGVLNIPQYNGGNVTSYNFASPLVVNTGTVSLPQATSAIAGYLTASDWSTFNDKLSTATAASTYASIATVNSKVNSNNAITGATKTKITYDSKGLVTSGENATTSDIAEGTNLYFTEQRALNTVLSGYVAGPTSPVLTSDNIVSAFGKLQAQINKYDSLINLLNKRLDTLTNTTPSDLSMTASLTNGLVAFYPFNGNARDSSGNGNHGTVVNATLANDRFGNTNSAYRFNGTNSFIDIANSFFDNGWENSTISLWFISASNQNPNLGGGQTLLNTSSSHGFSLGYSYQNSQKMYVFKSSSTISGWDLFANDEFNASPINLSEWYYVTIVKSGLDYTYYINGVLDKSITTQTLPTPNSMYPIRIGGVITPSLSDNKELFTGSIDDIRIYNRALTQSEITYLATH